MKEFLIKSILFLSSIIITLTLGELFLRMTFPTKTFNHHKVFCEYDELLGWRKIPNFKGRHITSEYDILESFNSQGIRGSEYSFEKGNNESRILILGDSFSEGYTVEYENLFSEILKKQLNERQKEKNIEVINAGTAGYSTDQELLYFQKEGRKYQPDLTILMFYFNDIWYNSQAKYWRGHKPQFQLKNDSLELIKKKLPFPDKQDVHWQNNIELYKKTRNVYFKIKRFFIPDEVSEEMPDVYQVYLKQSNKEVEKSWQLTAAILKELKLQTEKAGSELLVFYIPEKMSIYPAYWEDFKLNYVLENEEVVLHQPRMKMRETCADLNINLVDSFDSFVKRANELTPKDEFLYFKEDGHWNEKGHNLASEILYKHLKNGY